MTDDTSKTLSMKDESKKCEHVWIEYNLISGQFHCKNCDRDKCESIKCNREAIYSVNFVEYSSTGLCEIHYPEWIYKHVVSITSVCNKGNRQVTDLEDLLEDEEQQA